MMKYFLAALIAALPLVPVFAQTAPDGVLTPAPVPGRGSTVQAPADRAGRPDGAERSAPFSGLPSSLMPGSGESSPSTLGASERSTAPAPSLSR